MTQSIPNPAESGLANVANFRDVGANYNRDIAGLGHSELPALKEGNLFRSARLDDATAADVEVLKSKYGIKTVIDLRSDLERRECEHVASTFLFPAIEQEVNEELYPVGPNPLPPPGFIEAGSEEEKELQRRASLSSTRSKDSFRRRTRHTIEFAGPKFRKQGVWKPLSLWQKTKVVALIAAGQKPRAVQMIGEEVIAPQGLIGLYKNFIDYCSDEIAQALKLLADADNYPVLVHCTQGKDRTGIVTAMALSCAGVPLEQIVTDFHRSQAGLDSQREVMVREMAKTGLAPVFSDAPAEVLRETFGYVAEKYGGVERYLDKAGVGKEVRERLRRNLVAA
ncbi:protein-tyrosine phosphatase-like protein [Fimicolochytrium jonesii]|uniref:protein-tyrosine phosphatase-like protein n=1 Tax=Fimicolochytrium jonesii TaxID=1396493 RepID=UPI0022FEBEE7|nr:protein-tyrosine phosphatase-like protein [Fimicolochytrium jonesii]KAI8824046.1 protein-tyrosine phosphatase-like protein [Fimicolochytrium jonesii]